MRVRHRTNTLRLQDGSEFHRHWDPIFEAHAVKIYPGQYYATDRQDEVLVTTLGSCVSACVCDRSLGLGGMNHFMLPERAGHRRDEPNESAWNIAARYGNHAMELLINAILKRGGERRNLEIKVFGGARILSHMHDVGLLNVNFIREYLIKEGLTVIAEDLGGCHPRRVLFFPTTGVAKVKKVSALTTADIAREEMTYRSKLYNRDFSGTIELFDDPDGGDENV